MTDFTKIFRRTTYPTISPTAASQNQAGRTILITGGSDGIGRGIAKAFAQAQAAKVILVSRTQAKLETAAEQLRSQCRDTAFETIASDSGDIAAIQKLWSDFGDAKTFVDVLVLNAANLSPGVDPIEAIASFHFNVTANLHMLDHFQKQENSQSRQRILLNVSSSALQCYNFPFPGYGASKAGFANYLCHIAEFKPETDLRLINYHPGAVFTPAVRSNSPAFTGEEPLWDDPSLSADTAVWCCGKDAAFLHGRFVWANWDMDELLAMKDKILADPGLLKIGVAGVVNFTIADLFAKCQAVPVPRP